MKLNKELLMKVLNEHNWGIYLKSKPLEEMSTTNLGIMYHINEIEVDNLIEEYNANLEIPEE